METEGGDENDRMQKPAVPDEDLVSYVRQLELPLTEAAEAAAIANTPRHAVVAAAYREIHKREASLATHKKCSLVIEKLLQASTAKQLLRFSTACAPYAPWMCTNRYSSHVLETLLTLLSRVLHGDASGPSPVGDEGEGGSEEEAEAGSSSSASLTERAAGAILALSAEIELHATALLCDPCGTHVIRALLRVLGSGASSKTAAASAAAASPAPPLPASVSKQLKKTLIGLADSLLLRDSGAAAAAGKGTDERLYDLSCDPSASATLQVLMEVAASQSSSLRHMVARHLINWTDNEATSNGQAGEEAAPASAPAAASAGKKRRRPEEGEHAAVAPPAVTGPMWVRDLLRDRVGSRIVESVLVHGGRELFAALVEAVFAGNLLEMSLHAQANYVVQRLLLTCYTPKQREALISELLPHASELVSAGREGVIWHIAAAAAGAGAYAAALAAAGPQGGRDAAAPPTSSSGEPAGEGGHSSKAAKSGVKAAGGKPADKTGLVPAFVPGRCAELPEPELQKAVLAALSACVPPAALDSSALPEKRRGGGGSGGDKISTAFVKWWLDLEGFRRRSGDGGGAASEAAPAAAAAAAGAPAAVAHLPSSPLGARTLAALIRFRQPVCGQLVDALAALPQRELAGICGDPYCSRHVVEYVLSVEGGSSVGRERARLVSTLQGSYAALSQTRFGCWVVSKAFGIAGAKQKLAIAAELAGAEQAILASPGGRQVLRFARIEHFRRNPTGWAASWASNAAKVDALQSILGADAAAAPPAGRAPRKK